MTVAAILACDVCNTTTTDPTGERWGRLVLEGTQYTDRTEIDLCPRCVAKARGWKG